MTNPKKIFRVGGGCFTIYVKRVILIVSKDECALARMRINDMNDKNRIKNKNKGAGMR